MIRLALGVFSSVFLLGNIAFGSYLHTCIGDNTSMSFSESSIMGIPMITFYDGNNVSFQAEGQAIDMSQEIGSGLYVTATDYLAHVIMSFYADHPSANEDSITYTTSILLRDRITRRELNNFMMQCESKRVQF